MTEHARWFRHYRQSAAPRLRLLCFPSAGGGASMFRGWAARLPADIDVAAVCYPGRECRIAEEPVGSMAELADGITMALGEVRSAPLAFFGHSMGAIVGYEVATRARELDLRRLMVSGTIPPTMNRPRIEHRTDEAIVAHATKLSPANAAVFADPDLRELVLPAMRADYRLIGDYRPVEPKPVNVPVSAYLGKIDPQVDREQAEGWRELTTMDSVVHEFDGGHFYLTDAEAEVVATVVADLA